MKAFKFPVIPLTLFLAAGITANHYFLFSLTILRIIAAAGFCIFLIAFFTANKHFIQKPWYMLTSFLLAFVGGMLLQGLHYAPNSKHYYSHFLNDDVPIIKGTVSERLKPNNFSEKYYFEISSLNNQPASGKLLVSLPKDSLNTQLYAGDCLIIVDNPYPITKALNPNQFDYAAYMANQNVFHQLTLKENYIKTGQVTNFSYYTETFRNELIHSFDRHKFNPEVTNVINALLFGQRQDMDTGLRDSYINAGVIHILAISGLHIGILYIIISFLTKPLRRLGKKGKLLQLVVTLAFLWLFAILSGLSASVVRSVVMFSFVGIGMYFNRNTALINTIAVSALVLLLAKPNFLFEVGFQLSYAAVLSIVLLQPLYQKIRISKYKAVNYFMDLVMISIVAQIGVLPLSLYYFNQFPLLFPVANLVTIPLATLILSLGILVLALNFIFPAGALLFGKLLGFFIGTMNSFIQWVASFETMTLKDIPFTLLLTVLLYLLITCITLWAFKQTYRRTTAMLFTIALFQVCCMLTAQKAAKSNEMVVFHNREGSLLAIKREEKVILLQRDSLAYGLQTVQDYAKGNFSTMQGQLPLKNTLWFQGSKILVIDSLGVYDTSLKCDVLLLIQSPKINLEKVITAVQPKNIIADGTNYKSYLKRWEATCQKEKIPFHATAEKGWYSIK